MGLAAAWQLARRGQRVTILEQFEPGHLNGASHGITRNFNNAYSQLHYVDLLGESLRLWRDLEEQSGVPLLQLHGLVTHGDDLETALALAPPHLSCYHLTLEPNTAFASAPPPIPDPDSAADMQDHIEERLAEAGYIHYETSAFAKPHRECRHNLNYWTFGDYLGIGAGAHGKLSSHAGIIRETRPRHPSAYLAASGTGSFVQERRTIGASELPFEFMMNALRLNNGFPRRLFAERTGLPFEAAEAGLLKARQQGLIEVDGDTIRPSTRGRHFLNELLMLFLAA